MGSSSRFFVLLGLMLAIVLLISSEVAARDLAAQTMSTSGGQGGSGTGEQGGFKGNGPDRCGEFGCCGFSFGCQCCTYAGEAKDSQTTAKPQN